VHIAVTRVLLITSTPSSSSVSYEPCVPFSFGKAEEAQKRLLTRKQLILTTVPWDQKALLCWHEAFEFSFLMILQQETVL
jgi:hypothetical protein